MTGEMKDLEIGQFALAVDQPSDRLADVGEKGPGVADAAPRGIDDPRELARRV